MLTSTAADAAGAAGVVVLPGACAEVWGSVLGRGAGVGYEGACGMPRAQLGGVWAVQLWVEARPGKVALAEAVGKEAAATADSSLRRR